jgi:hypothetical protein
MEVAPLGNLNDHGAGVRPVIRTETAVKGATLINGFRVAEGPGTGYGVLRPIQEILPIPAPEQYFILTVLWTGFVQVNLTILGYSRGSNSAKAYRAQTLCLSNNFHDATSLPCDSNCESFSDAIPSGAVSAGETLAAWAVIHLVS